MIVGAFIGAPSYHMPAFTTFFDPQVTPSGPLWPLLMVTIACGAISGWHSLISSAYTSKQLDKETDALMVGGGSMLLEGILAAVALTAVAILPETRLPAIVVEGKWLPAFVDGGGVLMGFAGLPEPVAKLLAAVMLVILPITILHITLRIGRFVLVEILGERAGALRSPYVSAFVFAFIAWVLGSDRFGALLGYLWPTFGGSNQLLAALALLIATVWLAKEKKPTVFTGGPAAFMLVTTLAALGWLAYVWGQKAVTLAFPANLINGVLALTALILMIMGILMAIESWKAKEVERSQLLVLNPHSF